MQASWGKLKYALPCAVALICLHAALILATSSHWMKASYPFMILAPWLAFAACVSRAMMTPRRMRLAWMMVSIGVFLWAVGMSLAAWEDLSVRVPVSVADISDFSYFLYGVPILLVISWPTESERIPLFLWLDGVQAAITAALAYVALFSAFPFTHQHVHPVSSVVLSNTYIVENLLLLCFATVRMLTSSGTRDEKRFYQVLAGFLWAYTLCASWYNHEVVRLNGQTGLYDLLATLPFLFVATLALTMPLPDPSSERRSSGNFLAQLIDNGSPVLYTMAMLALGIVLIRDHFYIGIASIVIALAVYAIRMTMLQSFFLRSQRALRAARDELEAISLLDGLTGVANRRCFDQTLDRGWRQAIRMKQPISLLLIDLDHFKVLNDRYGHRAGDDCLVRVAEALQSASPRAGDLLARYGGEEFAAILSGTGREGACVVANAMLAAVRAVSWTSHTGEPFDLSVSIGAATMEPTLNDSLEELLEAADKALYRAKANGRDRFEMDEG